MYNKVGVRVFFLFYLFIAVDIFAQQELSIKKRKALDSFINNWNIPNAPGIAVAVLKDGKVIYKKCLGYSNLENNIPIQSNSIFQIASVSKQFTAMGIALLVDQGIINLDDDVKKFIPELNNYPQKITVANLLTHTSGLKDQWDLLYLSGWKPSDVITNQDALDIIIKQKSLNFATGSNHKYSNSGYTLLAQIIERVTHIPFQKWMDDNVFLPMKMNSSHFISNQSSIIKKRVLSYKSNEDSYEEIHYNSTTVGSNGLYSSLDDLCKWVKNYSIPTLGNPSVHNMLNSIPKLNNSTADLELGYGFGQEIEEYRGEKFIWHDGSDAGYKTLIGRFPVHGISFIILSNVESTDPFNVGCKIADILLEERFKLGLTIENKQPYLFLPDAVEKAIEGDYIINDTLTLRVNVFDHNVMAENSITREQIYFRPKAKTVFENKKKGISVNYLKDNKNMIDTLLFNINGNSYKTIKSSKVNAENLKEFVGSYYSEDLESSFKIVIKNQRLHIVQPRGFTIKIVETSPDEFEGEYWWLRVVNFKRNDLKEVIGFSINNNRTKNIEFKKI